MVNLNGSKAENTIRAARTGLDLPLRTCLLEALHDRLVPEPHERL
jgi:hypothetical protein